MTYLNPDLIADDFSLSQILEEKVANQHDDIYNNTIRGKEHFTSRVITNSALRGKDENYTGRHFFCKARPLDTMHDHCVPDPCTNHKLGKEQQKLLISLHPTMVSKSPMNENQRPPRFSDKIKMSFYGEGPNGMTAKMRDIRYSHKSKIDEFQYACAFEEIEEMAGMFGSGLPSEPLNRSGGNRKQRGDFPDASLFHNTTDGLPDNPSPNIPGPFSKYYDCSKKYKYTGQHPDFQGQEIYNGQFPNELLALAKHGKGGGAGQENGKTILAREAVRSYDEMAKAYHADTGRDLVASGYRPVYRQQDARQDAIKKYGSHSGSKAYKKTATPGNSKHGLGLAVDFKNGNIDHSVYGWTDKTYYWLVDNANAFGWYHPSWAAKNDDNEPWHWEYKFADKILKLNTESKSEARARRRAFEKANKIDCSKRNPKLKVSIDPLDTDTTLFDSPLLIQIQQGVA